MKAFIWTWAENQPNPLFNHTYLSAETGRWYNFEYNPEYPDLCRKISNDLPTSKFHLSYDSSCFEGYEINVPRTSWENTVVRELLRSSNIDFAHLSLNDL